MDESRSQYIIEADFVDWSEGKRVSVETSGLETVHDPMRWRDAQQSSRTSARYKFNAVIQRLPPSSYLLCASPMRNGPEALGFILVISDALTDKKTT
jgi:hypothetical protein